MVENCTNDRIFVSEQGSGLVTYNAKLQNFFKVDYTNSAGIYIPLWDLNLLFVTVYSLPLPTHLLLFNNSARLNYIN